MCTIVKVSRVLGIVLAAIFILLSITAILTGIFNKAVFNLIDEPEFREESLSIIMCLKEYFLMLICGLLLILPYSKMKKVHILPKIIIFLFMVGIVIYWNGLGVFNLINNYKLYSLTDIYELPIVLIENYILIFNVYLFLNIALKNSKSYVNE